MSFVGLTRKLTANCMARRGPLCSSDGVLRKRIDPPYNKHYDPTLAYLDSEDEITVPFNFNKLTKHFDSTDVKTIEFTRLDMQQTLATVQDKLLVVAGVSELYKDRCYAEFRVSDINNKVLMLHLKFPNTFDTGLYKCTVTLHDNNTRYAVQLALRIIDRDLKYLLTSE